MRAVQEWRVCALHNVVMQYQACVTTVIDEMHIMCAGKLLPAQLQAEVISHSHSIVWQTTDAWALHISCYETKAPSARLFLSAFAQRRTG